MIVHLMTRTLFVGDLEAQHKVWQQDLDPLITEVDAVVQMGNLISCTVDAKDKKDYGRNEAVLTLWEKVAPEKRLKLIGANEIAALNFPDEWTNSKSNLILRNSWLSREPNWYVALVDKNRLVTHAGLTHGEWVALGRPQTAVETAELLQEKYENTLNQGPTYRLTGRPNFSANPIWADPILELYPSWIGTDDVCPFDQIHGAASLNNERGRAAIANEDNLLHYLDTVNYRPFGSISTIKGATFRAMDCDLVSDTLPTLPKDKSFYVEKV